MVDAIVAGIVFAPFSPVAWAASNVTNWSAIGSFFFAACPVGHTPSVRFAMENRVRIEESLYNCLQSRPAS